MKANMMKVLVFLVVLLGMTATQASAIIFNLNQRLHDNGYSAIGYSLGTVEIKDNATYLDRVNVEVILFDSELKLLEFYLNYSGPVNSSAAFSIQPNTIEFDSNPNDNHTISPPGYNIGDFDLVVPGNGNLGNISTYLGELSYGNINLNASYFDALDTTGVFHVAAHIGQGDSTLPGGVSSIAVGDGPAPVPEPATMILLGAGFLGLAIYGKRRKTV